MQYDNPVSSSDVQATLTAESANLSDSTIEAINSLLNLDNVETVEVAGITGTTVQLPESGTASIVQGTVAGVKGDTVVVDLAAAEAAGAKVYNLQSDANLVVNLEGQAAAGAADVQLFAALADAIEAAVSLGVAAVLFNCSQPEVIGAAIDVARSVIERHNAEIAIGAYANAFPPQPKEATANDGLDELREDLDPPGYLAWAKDWRARGASMVGGCCGIGPEHIAELKRNLA